MSRLLFGGGDATELSGDTLQELRSEIPFISLGAGESADSLADVLAVLVEGKLAASRGAARRLLEQGGVYINGQRATAERRFILSSDLLPGRHVLLRKGSRDYLLVHVS
jgi:tyrosyl-tRNA synthetase